MWNDGSGNSKLKFDGPKFEINTDYKISIRLWKNGLFLHVEGLFENEAQVISNYRNNIDWKPGHRNNWEV